MFGESGKLEERTLKISYSRQKVGKYAVRNKSYVVNDTFCYYSDIDNSIYQVSEDTVTLRYYLDKGSFKNFRLCGKAGYSDNCLTVIEMSENNKYVLIVVLVNQKYYLLVYDKLKKVTCNYDLVDDDCCRWEISDINRMQCCDYTITGTRACVSATIICIFIFPLLITV